MLSRSTLQRLVLAFGIGVHLLLWASLQTGWLTRTYNDSFNRPGPGADFYALYHAGHQLETGANPYVMQELPQSTPDYAPYRYLPGVAQTLGRLVVQLPPRTAYSLWLALLEVVLLVDVLVVWRLIEDPLRRAFAVAAWLALPTLFLEWWMGQYTLLASSCVFLAAAAWETRRPRSGAWLWSAGVVLKMFPLAMGPLLLRRRRFGALVVAAVGLAAASVGFVVHPEWWEIFRWQNLQPAEASVFHSGNFGLQAFLYHLLGGPSAWNDFVYALQLVLVGTTVAALIRGRDDRVSIATTLLLLPLFYKDVWEHHYVVMLPALTLMLWAWPQRWRAIAFAYLIFALPSPLIWMQQGPATWDPSKDWGTVARVVYHAPKPLMALAMFGICVRAQLFPRQET